MALEATKAKVQEEIKRHEKEELHASIASAMRASQLIETTNSYQIGLFKTELLKLGYKVVKVK